jgi:hypothetical protein
MDSANVAFNCPDSMNLKNSSQIQLLLSLQKTISELKEAIAAAGKREGESIKVSSRMEARLSGPNFQITAITPEEQAIGTVDTVEWKWEIKPVSTGSQNLHLTLTALINVEGEATRRAIRTFDRKITVIVTPGQRLSGFLGKNWQWMWAALLIPVLGWLWKRAKRKEASNKIDL